jgi:hypothetical protein
MSTPPPRPDAARRHSCFNVIDNRSFIKIDVFVPAAVDAVATSQGLAEALDRARQDARSV